MGFDVYAARGPTTGVYAYPTQCHPTRIVIPPLPLPDLGGGGGTWHGTDPRTVHRLADDYARRELERRRRDDEDALAALGLL